MRSLPRKSCSTDKEISFLFAWVLSVPVAISAQVSQEWAVLCNHINGHDNARALALDDSGNVYVTASSLGDAPGGGYT